VPDSAKERLDLSTWEVAFCGAEPVRPSTLDKFAAAFAVCGFRREAFLPCFGLAEATLLVTGVAPSGEPRRLNVDAALLDAGRVMAAAEDSVARAFVSCGRPPAGITIRIVDPGSAKPQPEDRTGEIWVKGPNVAAGYWNQKAATTATFGARLEDGEGGYLRTGDLGFMDQGELFVTGRLKDLIIIRGRNLYPQDIEFTVEHAHQSVRPGRSVVFSAEIEGDERLIVVCEVARRFLLDPLPTQDAVKRAVASAHGIVPHEILLLEPSQLPRTSSGKPRRALSRERFLAGRLGEVVEAFE
jgi:acyl-CoA synthetase (AMP-forming)/AMP-acid ligase II